uniref:Uncharacterized protein n=1 Tax=Anguilla anguilla TaxID=7936 RepID=A0A0E9Q404_ANGAN
MMSGITDFCQFLFVFCFCFFCLWEEVSHGQLIAAPPDMEFMKPHTPVTK